MINVLKYSRIKIFGGEMVGLGTIINFFAVLIGGLIGHLFGRFITNKHQDTLSKACGISVMFIGIAGAMSGMIKIENSGLESYRTMFVVASLALGGFIGEIIDIEGAFEKFGKWLKVKTGNAKDKNFVEGFLTASFTTCIGAMTIVGALQDGILGDYTILATKSILDLVIIAVMTSSLGKGCVFSVIPIVLFQGSITLLSRFIEPIMTEAAMNNLSLIGSILIFCVGFNLVVGKKIRVPNLLPAVFIAIALAFI